MYKKRYEMFMDKLYEIVCEHISCCGCGSRDLLLKDSNEYLIVIGYLESRKYLSCSHLLKSDFSDYSSFKVRSDFMRNEFFYGDYLDDSGLARQF